MSKEEVSSSRMFMSRSNLQLRTMFKAAIAKQMDLERANERRMFAVNHYFFFLIIRVDVPRRYFLLLLDYESHENLLISRGWRWRAE